MQGFYTHPTVSQDRVLFVCEDDLWEVPLSGGRAIRLTHTPGTISSPRLSPDGAHVAFSATDEGDAEVWVMPTMGGPPQRLTFHGAHATVIGWQGDEIIFSSIWRHPFARVSSLFRVSMHGGESVPMDLGEGVWWDTHPASGARLLGRHSTDLARWKRYKGGLAAQIWVDAGDGSWTHLFADQPGGYACPTWIDEDRLLYMSDVEGYANLYTCDGRGENVTRWTQHTGFYVRHPSTDGRHVVYSRGGTLRHLDLETGRDVEIEIDLRSPRAQRSRRFPSASEYLEDFDVHPRGHELTTIARGKCHHFGLWEGGVRQTGELQGVRYSLCRHDPASETPRVLVVSDEGGVEHLEWHDPSGRDAPVPLEIEGVDLGRPLDLEISPDGACVAIANHRHELIVVDLESSTARLLDKSPYLRIQGFAWSPCSRWIAYGKHISMLNCAIFLADLAEDDKTHQVTDGSFRDTGPTFDPDGRHLYFLSYRDFNPLYDTLFFAMSFQRGERPYILTLREDLPDPLWKEPRGLDDDDDKKDEEDKKGDDQEPAETEDEENEGASQETQEEVEEDASEPEKPTTRIDLEGIERRMRAIPVLEGRYSSIQATSKRVFFLQWPIPRSVDDDPNARLRYFDLKKKKVKTFHTGLEGYHIGLDRKTLVMFFEDGLQVALASNSGPEDEGTRPGPDTGWVDLGRIALEVDPAHEWRQMLHEVWRLMRDHFWREDMSGVDWDEAWTRYSGLLDRVATRREFSEVVWTMQGELGTSHAYEYGGDHKTPPYLGLGSLGADIVWDDGAGGYRVEKIVRGDDWGEGASPLARPGLDVREGDVITALHGRDVDANTSLQEGLVHLGGRKVELTLQRPADGSARTVTVRTLRDDRELRYRAWVNERRALTHARSEGRVGYLHVPDMGWEGYAEFHRGFLAEQRRDALIVDVRHNGGGHVSSLLLEKLSRVILGYDAQRHGVAMTYPSETPRGPIVALTNAYAGSDGDIFSHSFKMMKLGPLMGARTWGGVIGIWPRHKLVDASVTTQPEFSFWFSDVGFGVENYGTEPDIPVAQPPESERGGADPQLVAAIDEALTLLQDASIGPPDLAPYPNLAPPEELP